MSKLTTQPTVITTAAVNPFTRRTFMKTSALTVGAVTLLSKGTALAEEGVGSSSGVIIPDVWVYSLFCRSDPTANQGAKSLGVVLESQPNSTWFFYESVQDIRKDDPWCASPRTSAVYFQVTGTGPSKGAVSKGFAFSGRIHSTVSKDAADSTPMTPPKYTTDPYTAAINEAEMEDITVRGTIDLDICMLYLEKDMTFGPITTDNPLPVVKWISDPGSIGRIRIPGSKPANEWTGPLLLSGYITPGSPDCSAVRLFGASTVEIAIKGTSTTIGGGLNLEFQVSEDWKVGLDGTLVKEQTVTEPNAATTSKVCLPWVIHLIKRRFNSSSDWIDCGPVVFQHPPKVYPKTVPSILPTP